MKLPEINWERIRAIVARAEELHAGGTLNCATWLSLVDEFDAESLGRLPLPGGLGRVAESAWFEALHSRSSERVA